MAKVMILTPFPPDGIGGAETFVKMLIQEASKKHEVILCTLKLKTKFWKGTGLKNFVSVFPRLTILALWCLIKHKPDIIHVQGLISGLIAVLLKKVFKVKVFITLLALYEFAQKPKWFQSVSRFIFNNCDVIFVEGENGRTDIGGLGVYSRIKTFNHWVDQGCFYPPDKRDDSKIRVLFLARPISEKGKHIVEAAEKILNDPKYKFTYVENCPYDQLPALYQQAHIVVVPSLYAEGYSRVVAEAASCGCAVITSNRGSLPEMVKEFGTVVTEPYAENFAQAIRDCKLEMKSFDSKQYALKHFSPKNSEVFTNEYSNA